MNTNVEIGLNYSPRAGVQYTYTKSISVMDYLEVSQKRTKDFDLIFSYYPGEDKDILSMTVIPYSMYNGNLYLVHLNLLYVEYEVPSLDLASKMINDLIDSIKFYTIEVDPNALHGSVLYRFEIGNYTIEYTYNDDDSRTDFYSYSYTIETRNMSKDDTYYYDRYICLYEIEIKCKHSLLGMYCVTDKDDRCTTYIIDADGVKVNWNK